jgi:hypothetical protein
MAAALESALAARNISVARDMTFLRAGENFAEAIEREVASTDSFLVLVTEAAAASRWVHQEAAWTTEQLAANRIVKRIVPLLDEHAWMSFPALEDLHRFPLDRAPSPAQLDRLAEELRTRI